MSLNIMIAEKIKRISKNKNNYHHYLPLLCSEDKQLKKVPWQSNLDP